MPPTDRASRWSVTCNFKTVRRETVDAQIETAKLLGWGIEGQLEKGEEGTEHYQLLLKTPQVRFSAVKKVFPTAHIEVARNVVALQNYVHKEDSRIETLKTVENVFVTWKQVRNRFFEWYVENHSCEFMPIDEQKLLFFDQFIGLCIVEGQELDLIGVNPQYRSCITRYWDYYIRRQLDRQTDIQEVTVPTIT